MSRINFDTVSCAPMLPEARHALDEALALTGNPSSAHEAGRQAAKRLEQARKQVAQLIHADPDEIYFASCGTEANAWAIRGLLAANRRKGLHLIVSAIEHPSILLMARRFEREGADVSYLPVTGEGVVEPESLRQALKSTTALVSIMHANGEIGTIEPIEVLATIAKEAGALFHTDAVASAGHAPIDVRALGVDALTLASNSMYGPVGAAALFVRDNLRILPLLEGGGQERGARSGTENVPAIAGFGAAADAARRDLPSRGAGLAALRDRLKAGIAERVDGARFAGSWSNRLPQNVHVCVPGATSESLVLGLDAAGIAVGTGSACNAKAMRPSHVLQAINMSEDNSKGALVITLGIQTTEREIDRFLEVFPSVVVKLRRVTSMTAAK